jgi:hypothetical protein
VYKTSMWNHEKGASDRAKIISEEKVCQTKWYI